MKAFLRGIVVWLVKIVTALLVIFTMEFWRMMMRNIRIVLSDLRRVFTVQFWKDTYTEFRVLIREITLVSFLVGMACAILMISVNSFLTLKIGVIEEGFIVCLMIFALYKLIRYARTKEWLTPYEAVVVGTMGSSGGAFSFIANFFASLELLGSPLTYWEMVLFAGTTSMIGLVASVPMRQIFVVGEDLKWPGAKASITAIEAITQKITSMQPRILAFFSVLAMIYVFLSGGIGWFPEVNLVGAFGLSAYGIGVAWSPMLIGAGYLIGLEVGFGFLVSSIILTLIGMYAPLPLDNGVPIMPHKFVYPGVTALTVAGITTLAFNWRMMWRGITSLGRYSATSDRDKVMSGKTLLILAAIVCVAAVIILHVGFAVAVMYAIAGLGFGGIILNLIATRAYAETYFNPVRVMGILIMVLFALMGADSAPILIIAAGLAAGAIGQSSILTQDIRVGRHFNVPSKVSWFLRAVVVIPVAFTIAGVYLLVRNTYQIGSESLRAPIAVMWSTVAKVLSGEKLPDIATTAMIWGGIFGFLVTIVDMFARTRKVRVATMNDLRVRVKAQGYDALEKEAEAIKWWQPYAKRKLAPGEKPEWRKWAQVCCLDELASSFVQAFSGESRLLTCLGIILVGLLGKISASKNPLVVFIKVLVLVVFFILRGALFLVKLVLSIPWTILKWTCTTKTKSLPNFQVWLTHPESLDAKTSWRFCPHSFGMTIGLVLPAFYDLSFFLGAIMLCYIIPKVLKTDNDTLNTLAASGIVGEGVGGLGVAILKVFKVL